MNVKLLRSCLSALVVLGAAGLGILCFPRTVQAAATQATGVVNINARLDFDQPGRPIPNSFLGLSIEYSQIVDLTTPENGHQAAFINLINNLQQYNGPFILRIGGNSTDKTFWQGLPDTTPHYAVAAAENNAGANNGAGANRANRKKKMAITLTPELITNLQGVIAETHCKLILGLNLACDNPNSTMVWAKKAIAGLGSSIMAFEIGNEPSGYAKNGYRPKDYNLATYYKEYEKYVATLRPLLTNGIQIAGGAFCCGWLASTTQFVQQEHQNVNIVTVHYYSLSGAKTLPAPIENEDVADSPVKKPSRVPTIAHLLANSSSTAYAIKGQDFINAAASYNLPVRWAEMNSVNNGGNANVSGSFAAALWAVDSLFEILHSGATGVNFHMGADYATFQWNRDNKLQVCPLYYGQLFFAQAVQNHARLIPVDYQTTANVKIWATLDAANVLRIVVINKDLTHNAQLSIAIPGRSQAQLETMFAPSVEAKTGVMIDGGGQIISYDNSTDGKPRMVPMLDSYPLHQYVTLHDGVYTFSVPHTQAEMLIVPSN
jgi:hypothetical protein